MDKDKPKDFWQKQFEENKKNVEDLLTKEEQPSKGSWKKRVDEEKTAVNKDPKKGFGRGLSKLDDASTRLHCHFHAVGRTFHLI